MRRAGSWFVADQSLEQDLVRAGFPSAPSSRSHGFFVGGGRPGRGDARGSPRNPTRAPGVGGSTKRVWLTLLAVFCAVAAAPATALAKGPIEASIDGPGLGSPITIRGEGEDALANGSPIMALAEGIGFFPAAFGPASWNDGDPVTKDVNPMLARRPAGALGPRYLVTYVVPGPEGIEDVLRQELYPYAASGPVSFMPPRQRFFGWRETTGGWYQGGPGFERALIDAGLPESPPAVTAGGGAHIRWGSVLLAGLGIALAITGLTIATARRRPRPA